MTKTYTQFKEYYTRKMWRVGDVDWNTDLDTLIDKAEGKISRDLNHMDLWQVTLENTTDNIVVLPADCGEILSVVVTGAPFKAATAISRRQWDAIENSEGGTASIAGKYYSIFGPLLYVTTAATPSNPQQVVIEYNMGIKPYKNYVPGPADTQVEPFYSKHQDFYEAALNMQAYDYLKDFQLSQKYDADYGILLEDMRRDANYRKYGSGQLDARPAGMVM
jgi:hypothetical protein